MGLGDIGIMENEMETTIIGLYKVLGLGLGLYAPIMENQMEKKMENEMETLGTFKGEYRDM